MKIISALLLLFIFISSDKCLAQRNEIDSLRQQLLIPQGDSNKIVTLQQLAAKYKNVNIDTTLLLLSEALEISRKNQYPILEYNTLVRIVYAYDNKGDFSNSLKTGFEILKLVEKLADKKRIAEAYKLLSYTYSNQQYYAKAIDYLNLSLKYGEEVKDEIFMADVMNQMGNVHLVNLKEFDKAESYYKKAIDLYIKNQVNVGASLTTINLGTVYYEKKLYEKALTTYKEAEKMSTMANKPDLVSFIYGKIGIIYHEQKKYKDAQEYFNKALTTAEKLNLYSNKGSWLVWLGKNALRTNELEKAKSYFFQALNQQNTEVPIHRLKSIYQGLAEVFEKTRDLSEALKYQKLLVVTGDTINARQERQKLAELKTRYKVEEQQQKIFALEKQNTIHDLQLSQEKNYRIIMGVSMIFLLTVIVYVVYTLKLKSKLVTALTKQKQEIELQHTQIKNINQVLELRTLRAQINPHFIFNALSSIQNFIIKNAVDDAIHYLQKFTKLIRGVLENSMVLSISLKEEIEMLKHYIELERLRFDFKFDYEFIVSPELNAEETTIPYLLIQPYVENAILHGLRHKESQGILTIHFSEVNDSLKCVIEDNGVGRKAAQTFSRGHGAKHKSLGLSITNQRINKIGEYTDKKVTVQTIDKEENGIATGTLIEIIIPRNKISEYQIAV